MSNIADRDDAIKEATDAALKYLGYKTRTCEQMSNFLHRKGFDTDIVEIIIDKLVGYDYLNDSRFAKNTVEQAVLHNNHSLRKAQQKLYTAGIPSDDVQNALSGIEEGQELENARYWAKKYDASLNCEKREKLNKIYMRLVRKGFNYDTARRAIGELGLEEEFFD